MAIRVCLLVASAWALAAVTPPAVAQGKAAEAKAGKATRVYEPVQRRRMGLDCMKEELMHGNLCIRRCQREFRMDLSTSPVTCHALRPEARYVPPKVEFATPEKPAPRGAPGS